MRCETLGLGGQPKKPTVISFVSWEADTGKTTLIEQVLKILKKRGCRVGAMKHDAHDFSIDHPGKDSYRFTAAGAEVMLLVSSDKLAVVKKRQSYTNELDLIATYFTEMDIVLVEGFKRSSLAKIEVRRKREGIPRMEGSSDNLVNVIAVASDDEIAVEVPVLNLNNPFDVADFIQYYAERQNAAQDLPTLQSLSSPPDIEKIWW